MGRQGVVGQGERGLLGKEKGACWVWEGGVGYGRRGVGQGERVLGGNVTGGLIKRKEQSLWWFGMRALGTVMMVLVVCLGNTRGGVCVYCGMLVLCC